MRPWALQSLDDLRTLAGECAASTWSSRIPTSAAEVTLDPSRCVHNYGHGGAGVALAWGCARDVCSIVARA
jgi:hypothetical protein